VGCKWQGFKSRAAHNLCPNPPHGPDTTHGQELVFALMGFYGIAFVHCSFLCSYSSFGMGIFNLVSNVGNMPFLKIIL
jgi:hypothetical protein